MCAGSVDFQHKNIYIGAAIQRVTVTKLLMVGPRGG